MQRASLAPRGGQGKDHGAIARMPAYRIGPPLGWHRDAAGPGQIGLAERAGERHALGPSPVDRVDALARCERRRVLPILPFLRLPLVLEEGLDFAVLSCFLHGGERFTRPLLLACPQHSLCRQRTAARPQVFGGGLHQPFAFQRREPPPVGTRPQFPLRPQKPVDFAALGLTHRRRRDQQPGPGRVAEPEPKPALSQYRIPVLAPGRQ